MTNDYLLYVLFVSLLAGFIGGVLGSMSHQFHQKKADEKRWNEIKDFRYKNENKNLSKIVNSFLSGKSEIKSA